MRKDLVPSLFAELFTCIQPCLFLSFHVTELNQFQLLSCKVMCIQEDDKASCVLSVGYAVSIYYTFGIVQLVVHKH